MTITGLIERLFSTEADQDPVFAQSTSLLPKTLESEEALKAALTSPNWLILSGEKGTGKTSYLFLGLRDLPPRRLGVYCPFDTEGSKFEIKKSDDRDNFLCKHLYGGLITKLDEQISVRLPRRQNEIRPILEDMIDALIPVEREQTKTMRKQKGILARLGIQKGGSGINANYGKTIDEEIIERRNLQARPDYERFRKNLESLVEKLGFESVGFFIDEVNTIRLTESEITVLFEHLYTLYKVHKDKIWFKIAVTDDVEVPPQISSGSYFEPMNLKSLLLYPKEFNDFIKEIFNLRLKLLKIDRPFNDFFTDASFSQFVMASMGNPRDFFLLARQAWQSKQDKIDTLLATEKIKKRGGELESDVFHVGGIVQDVYYKIVDALKERSEMKLGNENSPTGVSYFLISNFDTLKPEVRDAIGKLEELKIIFATGSYKSLRRRGQKAEMYVLSHPIAQLKSIRFLDVVKAMNELGQTEGQIISLHRAQIEL
jgi:hypothetical protein